MKNLSRPPTWQTAADRLLSNSYFVTPITGSETDMKHLATLVLAAALLASCRTYDYRDRTSKDTGLMPAEQYARYGREQAELVAAGRELAHAPADSTQQAVAYAQHLPDVAEVTPDPRGHWLLLRFKSGWRAATPPIADGKRGAETVGLPAK